MSEPKGNQSFFLSNHHHPPPPPPYLEMNINWLFSGFPPPPKTTKQNCSKRSDNVLYKNVHQFTLTRVNAVYNMKSHLSLTFIY